MAEDILRDRHRRVLRFLNGKQACITGESLAKRLNVSSRTVRSDIVEINRCIDPTVAEITSIRGKGYRLEIYDRERFHRYISGNTALLTREDRTQYLLLRVLWSDVPLPLDQLEDEMYVSRTTLEGDIRAMQSSWIAKRLHFLRNRDTLFLVQDEPEIRRAFLRLYSENIDFNSRSGIVSAGSTLNLERLSVLRADLRKLLCLHKAELDDFSFIYFSLAAWISSFRLGRLPASSPSETASVAEIIKETGVLFREKYAISLPVSELCWLQKTLNQLLRHTEAPVDAILRRALGEASALVATPFWHSDVFFSTVGNFIRDCSNGLAFPRFDAQDLLLELASAHPDLAQVCQCLTESVISSLNLAPEDIDPLSLLPSLISERGRFIAQHPALQPVALVACHLSGSIGEYLCHRLALHFKGRLRVCGPYPIYDRSVLEHTQCDFLISTVDMTIVRSLSVPTVTISPRLTPADFGIINHMIYETMRNSHSAQVPTQP